MYYIKENDKITFADDDLQRLKNTLLFKPELSEADIVECEEGYTVYDFELMTEEEAEAKEEAKEQERINMLTMTRLDFLKVIMSFGVTTEQINAYFNEHADHKLAFDYCQNVYCGTVRQALPVTVGDITITDEMIVQAFEEKNKTDDNTTDTAQ